MRVYLCWLLAAGCNHDADDAADDAADRGVVHSIGRCGSLAFFSRL